MLVTFVAMLVYLLCRRAEICAGSDWLEADSWFGFITDGILAGDYINVLWLNIITLVVEVIRVGKNLL